MNKNNSSLIFLILSILAFAGVVIWGAIEDSSLNQRIEDQNSTLDSLATVCDGLKKETDNFETRQNQQKLENTLIAEDKSRLKLTHFLQPHSGNSYYFRNDIESRLKKLGFSSKGSKLVMENDGDYGYLGVRREKFERNGDGGETAITLISYDMEDGDYSYDILIEFGSSAERQAFIDNTLTMSGVSKKSDSAISIKDKMNLDISDPGKIRLRDIEDDKWLPRYL